VRKTFVRWWHITFSALLIGVPTGIALEFARRAYNQVATEEVTRYFESKGMSPPLITDSLQLWVVPIATTVGFVLVALFIFGVIVCVRHALHSTHAAQQIVGPEPPPASFSSN
jgi:hypothetical protein